MNTSDKHPIANETQCWAVIVYGGSTRLLALVRNTADPQTGQVSTVDQLADDLAQMHEGYVDLDEAHEMAVLPTGNGGMAVAVMPFASTGEPIELLLRVDHISLLAFVHRMPDVVQRDLYGRIEKSRALRKSIRAASSGLVTR